MSGSHVSRVGTNKSVSHQADKLEGPQEKPFSIRMKDLYILG